MEEKPAIVNKWSWGAAALSFIYGVGNKAWMTFLIFVPMIYMYAVPFVVDPFSLLSPTFYYTYLGIFLFMMLALFILFGIKGHQWAWKNKDYPDEYFESVQKTWDRAGLVLFCIWVVFIVIAICIGISNNNHQTSMPDYTMQFND